MRLIGRAALEQQRISPIGSNIDSSQEVKKTKR
jgi:hypothetical protein